MCDFGSMLFGGLRAAGSLLGGFAGSSSHSMSSSLAAANADLLATQAKIGESKANTALVRGNYDEFLQRRKVDHVLATEKTSYASSNVDPTYGSPLLIQGFSAAQGETDAQIIRARTASEYADALTGVANTMGERTAQIFKSASEATAARTSKIAGFLGAGTAFLSGGSKWASLGAGSSSSSSFGLGIPVNAFGGGAGDW